MITFVWFNRLHVARARPKTFSVQAAAVIGLALVPSWALFAADQGPSAAVKRGQAQFQQSCGFCHAPDATGSGKAPNLLRSELVRHDENGNLIGPVIRYGRPSKGMPAIHLSDAQIANVIAYLRWRMQVSDRANPADPKVITLRRLLTGDATAGKGLFEAKCAGCHSASGDLAGIAKKYPPAELQARFLYPPDVKKKATITTPTGEQVKGELLYKDEFAVAVRDRDGVYHSWPAGEVATNIDDPLAAHLKLLHTYTNPDVHNLFAYLETLK